METKTSPRARSKRQTTVYFDEDVAMALKRKALATGKTVTWLMNAALRRALAQDAEHHRLIEGRKKQPPLDYMEFLDEMQRDGRL